MLCNILQMSNVWYIFVPMKRALLILMVLSSCASPMRIQEDVMYKTREYCGEFVSISAEKWNYEVQTTEAIFHVKDSVSVPKGVRCYFKLIEERVPGSASMVWVVYFTWDGTDQNYRVCQNFVTGDLL